MTIRLLVVVGLTMALLACSEDAVQIDDETQQPPDLGGREVAESKQASPIDKSSPMLKDIHVPFFNQQQVPSSARSREAIDNVAPSLVYALQQQELVYGSPIFMRIFKEERELELWVKKDEGFKLFHTYSVAAMSGELGPKLKEGDCQAPEGFYYVPPLRMNPNSRFHLSFNLGYPNTYDRHHARTGSSLMVHGGRASIGCFAMTDPRIEEIYALADAALRNGQKFFRVHIFPFRMTEQKMASHSNSRWAAFWANLKAGYDFFESSGQVPNVTVRGGRYQFE